MADVSISPDGVRYEFPDEAADAAEVKELERITEEQRAMGREIVAVQGLGFVGCVMAAIVADAAGEDGKPAYFVHGQQRVSARSYWKVPFMNTGVPPVEATDPEIAEIFPRTVNEKKTLRATWHNRAFELADIIVVDIQLDATKPEFGNAAKGYCDTKAFESAMRTLGRHMRPDGLVLVETTVPPGTCEHIVKPILEEEFITRGIDIKENPPQIAHSYERVMPGAQYVSSIRDFWRTYSALNAAGMAKAEKFLKTVLNWKEFPIYQLGTTNASEIAKTMENTFRAVNIALIHEWALLAEDVGVNLFEVVKSIRVRPTHCNMMNPGFGVGGYCLTKDPVLANWASLDVFKRKEGLPIAVQAVDINDTMPLHSVDLTREALGGDLKGKRVHLLGVSYLKDVGDTRHSPSATFWNAVVEAGAEVSCHDPLVKVWPEVEGADVQKDLMGSLKDADAVVFAVGHREYAGLDPAEVVKATGKTPAIIDTQNLLTDEELKGYLKLGCEVRGVGKGHIPALK